MASYKSASYQQDVINQIVETEEVYLYGPGYEYYNISDTIDDIIVKSSFEPDVIILGHAWLSDKDGDEFARILGSVDFEDKKLVEWLKTYD